MGSVKLPTWRVLLPAAIILLGLSACGTPVGGPIPAPAAGFPVVARGGVSGTLSKVGGPESGVPVLLVHGRNGSAANFRAIAPRLIDVGRPVYAVEIVPSNADPREMQPVLEGSIQNLTMRTQTMTLDVLAHSMGGLVTRAVIKDASDSVFVRRLVTLATPNHGSLFALFFSDPAARQLRPQSEFLIALNQGDESPGNTQYTSIYSRNDTSVQPATSSRLDGATNIGIWGPTHGGILTNNRAIGLALKAIQGDSEL